MVEIVFGEFQVVWSFFKESNLVEKWTIRAEILHFFRLSADVLLVWNQVKNSKFSEEKAEVSEIVFGEFQVVCSFLKGLNLVEKWTIRAEILHFFRLSADVLLLWNEVRNFKFSEEKAEVSEIVFGEFQVVCSFLKRVKFG